MKVFTGRVNKSELSRVAAELLRLLEAYRRKSNAAEKVFVESKSLLKQAINGEIESPVKAGFLPWEFWRGGDLFGLEDLCEAAARFHLLLRGAKSLGHIE
jgi:hypothetical protein